MRLFCGLCLAIFLGWMPGQGLAQQSLQFRVSLSGKVANGQVAQGPTTGRLYVFLTQDLQKQPMRGLSWFKPEPFVGLDVQGVEAGQVLEVDDRADGFPGPLSKLPFGKYRVQAVLDHDIYYPEPGAGPGNFFSSVVELDWREGTSAVVPIELDQVVPEIEYPDTDRVKFVQRKSALLSEHHGREVIDRVAVILPESYETAPERRYPVYYEVTGFGGTLRGIGRRGPNRRNRGASEGASPDVEYIRVMLTGECKYGHHVYANSAKNGPRGDALVEEMIPEIDRQFRTIADSKARYVGGHSSGGWSSLWLQVKYPDTFGGVFSSSPDPVDFRDFQGTNLYETPPQSLYVDAQGKRRPLARNGDEVSIWYEDFGKMDFALKRGGQLRSFEAVFSPLDAKGEPAEAWNWSTGYVHPEVIEHWKQYDISHVLGTEWSELGPKLAGKIHVVMGDKDTFYLEGATHRLADRLAELGSDAQIHFIPNASHNLPPEARAKLSEAMKSVFLKHYNVNGSPK